MAGAAEPHGSSLAPCAAAAAGAAEAAAAELPRVVLLTFAEAYFSDGPTSSTSSSMTVRFSPSRVSYERCLSRPGRDDPHAAGERLGDVLGRLAPDGAAQEQRLAVLPLVACCGRTCAASTRS